MPDNDPQQGEWLPDPTGRFKLRWQRDTGEWTRHVYDHDKNPHQDPYAPEPTRPRKKRRIWRWVLIVWGASAALIVVLAVIGALIELPDPEPAPAATKPATTRPAATPTTAPAPNAKELFEGCVSAWDGNHEGLEALIRGVLNDPGSMETHGTYYNPNDSLNDGNIRIRLDYGARNTFGGMVRTSAWADMDTDCDIIRVTDYGF